MTQIELARNNKYSYDMKIISRREDFNLITLRKRISQGKIVIPQDIRKQLKLEA